MSDTTIMFDDPLCTDDPILILLWDDIWEQARVDRLNPVYDDILRVHDPYRGVSDLLFQRAIQDRFPEIVEVHFSSISDDPSYSYNVDGLTFESHEAKMLFILKHG